MNNLHTLTKADFIKKINLGKTTPNTDTVMITPELAKLIMNTRDLGGRPKNKVKAKMEYTHLLSEGNFDLCGFIVFDPDGVLINGRARLLASIDSGKPIPTGVAFGYTKSLGLDRHTRSSLEENAEMVNGHVYKKVYDMAIIDIFKVATNTKYNPYDREVINMYDTIRDKIEELEQKIKPVKGPIKLNRSTMAAFLALLLSGTAAADEIAEMYETMNKGIFSVNKTDVLRKIHDKVIRQIGPFDPMYKCVDRTRPMQKASEYMRHFAAYLAGKNNPLTEKAADKIFIKALTVMQPPLKQTA